ncbi:glycosyltransferase [Proteus cibi]|uniref:Glycosyltransferase n=1 Tax=Proteus cibi TaxID=2050966 RepID=A0ABU6EI49_9GAMM|nr:glycosyltransferase [Proteus cibi]MEB6858743.1 glycosyltransferase [Proteus cibi]MEB7090182.1 glycosyltransferase [Proteus cibi]
MQEQHIDELRIWVSKKPYLSDSGINEEPKWAEKIRSTGIKLSFIWTENTGPYRKIIPALKLTQNDDILVYADDDVIYGSKWLQELVTIFYKNESKYIVATRVRKVIKGKLYNEFPIITEQCIMDDNYIVTGIGGVILKRGMIKETFINDDNYLTISPLADDIWLSKIYQLSNTKLFVYPNGLKYINEIQHDQGLSIENTRRIKLNFIKKAILKIKNKKYKFCQNDIYMKAVDNYFQKKIN